MQTQETAEETTQKSEAAAEPTLVEFLKGQLAEANETLVAPQGGADRPQVASVGHEGYSRNLLVIARGSVGNMLVALNSSSAAADGMDATTLLAEHARVSEIFKSKYKIGGVAATKPETEDTKKASTFHDPVFAFAASTVSWESNRSWLVTTTLHRLSLPRPATRCVLVRIRRLALQTPTKGKFVKFSVESGFILASAGDPIEGIVTSVESATKTAGQSVA